MTPTNTPTSKLDEVRAKVIEAVPEIVELKRGCLLGDGSFVEDVSTAAVDNTVIRICDRKGWSRPLWVHTENLEKWKAESVVGRPITLADVLRAIDKATHVPHAADQSGWLWELGDASVRKPEPTGVQWNLALPLDEQEPEVIEFLYKILCV